MTSSTEQTIPATVMTLEPNAPAIIEASRPMMTRGTWGDGVETVCMMSALVPGASEIDDCVTAGWPHWLTHSVLSLFDSNAGAESELAAAIDWALRIAHAISVPTDYRQAGRLYALRLLEHIAKWSEAPDLGAAIALTKKKEPTDEEVGDVLLALDRFTDDCQGYADFRLGIAAKNAVRMATPDLRARECPIAQLHMNHNARATESEARRLTADARNWLAESLERAAADPGPMGRMEA